MKRIEDTSPMRLAFVTGVARDDGTRHYPTMGEVAEQFGVSLSTVTHKASEQRWMDDRQDFQRRVYENAVAQYESEFSRVLARADLDAAIVAADLIHAIRRHVEHTTDQERVALSKTISRPLRELLGVVHMSVGIEQTSEELEVMQVKRPGKAGQDFESELVA